MRVAASVAAVSVSSRRPFLVPFVMPTAVFVQLVDASIVDIAIPALQDRQVAQ